MSLGRAIKAKSKDDKLCDSLEIITNLLYLMRIDINEPASLLNYISLADNQVLQLTGGLRVD